MSFLNSVLSSINTGAGQLPSATVSANSTPTATSFSQTTPKRPSTSTATNTANSASTPNLKRKASETFSKPEEKRAQGFYDGEKKPSTLLSARPIAKPVTKARPDTARPSSASTLAKPTAPANPQSPSAATPTTTVPKNPPKKGSFAEIMARQNAAKTAPPMIIQNKPKERISEKQKLKLLKRGLWDKEKNAPKKPEKPGDSRSSFDSKEAALNSTKAKTKKGVEIGYKGTANAAPPPKPKLQPSYRGTMKTVPKDLPAREKPKPRPPRDRYLDTDEEEEEDEDEDLDDAGEEMSNGGYSDESDDMEAGFDDVEEEEAEAIKQAKRDDAREAALEAKLKGEKEERKKRLMQLAKSAKPRSY